MELTRRGFLCILDYQQWLGCLLLTGLSGWGYYVGLGSSFILCLAAPWLSAILLLFLSGNMGRENKKGKSGTFIY